MALPRNDRGGTSFSLATNTLTHRWSGLRLTNGELSMTNQNNPGQQNQNPGQKPGQQQQGGGQKPGQQQQDPGRQGQNPDRQGQQPPGQNR
jgi:hypothetical protein